ncbi:MAG: aldehyde dehydrogenase family protein [Hahellaceae bacterium]|nr:aldehyde dehydrogenase family protein [Hahellaceae bacterium]MCP5169175.1 aldehyde dehydrogenase family protein [Hahellaceae bacterium]
MNTALESARQSGTSHEAANIQVRHRLTQASLYQIGDINAGQAAAVFASARSGLGALSHYPLSARLQELRKVRDLIFAEREAIVDQLVAETGKCRTDALVSEIMGVMDYCDWLLRKAPSILSDQKVATPLALLGKKSRIYHEALGIVLIISPWNYPFHIGVTSIFAALAAGNSVIYKPSELTPLHGLLERLFAVSPLLRSALQVVYGAGETAQQLIAQRPAKIFFTGSARTGKRLLAQAAPLLIPVELELGGKDAMLVFDDVNLARTVAGCLWGAMTNAGQSCTSVERVFVQRTIYDAFVRMLKSEAEKLVVNAGDAGDADIGAITADFQWEIIQQHIQDAVAKGARLVCGGESLGDTLFLMPTIVESVNDTMQIQTAETFGPVLTLTPFDTEEEAVQLANQGEFGLSASVWSKDLARADRVARLLEVGAVSINNVMLTEGNPNLPFGGARQSGFGRVKGAEGLLGMTRSKAVIIDKQSKKIEANWYPYTHAKYRLFGRFMAALFGKGIKRWFGFAVSGVALENEAQKPR